jgi:hypothetical protein
MSTYSEKCKKCDKSIAVETDDKKYAEKKIKEWIKKHKCKEAK